MVVGLRTPIHRSTNWGATWDTLTAPVVSHLFKVSFGSATGGVAVGAPGTFLTTEDAGATWTVTRHGDTVFPSSAAWLGPSDMAAASYSYEKGVPFEVWHTTDGGVNWVVDTVPLVQGRLIATRTGVLRAYGTRPRRNDSALSDAVVIEREAGGQWIELARWPSQPRDAIVGAEYGDVVAAIVDNQVLAWSSDRGSSWKRDTLPLPIYPWGVGVTKTLALGSTSSGLLIQSAGIVSFTRTAQSRAPSARVQRGVMDVWPVPAAGVLRVRPAVLAGPGATLSMFDALGRRVHSELLGGRQTMDLDVSQLSDGSYLIAISDRGSVLESRLITVSKVAR